MKKKKTVHVSVQHITGPKYIHTCLNGAVKDPRCRVHGVAVIVKKVFQSMCSDHTD